MFGLMDELQGVGTGWTRVGRRLLPLVAVALVGSTLVLAGCGGGSSKKTPTATKSAATATKPASTPTAAATPTPIPTEPAVSAGLQSTGDSSDYTSSDAGGDSEPYVPPANLTGPGPEEGTDMTLVIPSIGVNASIYSRSIGTNGQMGNPSGAFAVDFYDFAENGFQGLGGRPGEPGANAVFAGHVDYIHVGPAVFWSIRDLQPGDMVTVYTGSGPVNYSIQWSEWADPDVDFTSYVGQTGQDSITLVTCIGAFSGGHYSNRLIVRGVRV